LKSFDGAILSSERVAEHVSAGRCAAAFADVKNMEAYFGQGSGDRRWAARTGLLQERFEMAVKHVKYASDDFLTRCVLRKH